ncbi:MAG: alpha/beta fold hydrolase [Gemmatimonas sp.]|nr:alpha/beta fold hydrolase [Gemmatimonas sp.]
MRDVMSDLPPALRDAPSPVWVDAPAGYRIPVRRFGMDLPGRPVVLLHGLQSHSGWFVQSARHVSSLGLPAHAFDRCGSGVNEGNCDAGPGLTGLLAEIDAVADGALAGTDHDSVHILGHCFGSIPALLYASEHGPDRVASLVLATPALYTHTDLPGHDKARVLWSLLTGRPTRVPVPLFPEQFSERGEFVEFVRKDPLVLQEVSARFLNEVRRARKQLPEAARRLDVPLFIAMAGGDPICDNPRNRRLLKTVPAPTESHEYAGARHILEFSRQRAAFFEDLSEWFRSREAE